MIIKCFTLFLVMILAITGLLAQNVLTGLEENFNNVTDTAFWANVVGADQNSITGSAKDSAFKYICNPNNNFWFNVWWKFDAEPHTDRYFDISRNPYVKFRAKVEPGATWNGSEIDNVAIGFDINGTKEYLGQTIPDDGEWHDVLFEFDQTNPVYAYATEFRLHPGVSDKNAVFDPGFVGILWLDDVCIGDKVEGVNTVLTGLEETFDTDVDVAFWANLVGDNSIIGSAENNAFKYVCNPNSNFWLSVWWKFNAEPNINRYFNISENPYISCRVKAEPGAKWNGSDVDNVEIGFDINGASEYLGQTIPDDGQWHYLLFKFDGEISAYTNATEFRFHPGVSDKNATFDPGFIGTIWLDDIRIGDKVDLNAELNVETGFSEDFTESVNLDFWIPNKNTHDDGTPIFFILQMQGALKNTMKQENYNDGQMYDFTKEGFILDITSNPKSRISLKVESGAKLAGIDVDNVSFSMSPFSSDSCSRGGIDYPYSQQHSPITFSVPTDDTWHTYTFDWNTPDAEPAKDGYIFPNSYNEITFLLLETFKAAESLYEAIFWLNEFEIGDSVLETTTVNPVNTIWTTKYPPYQNYPNPFNISTTIQYYLPKSTYVTIAVFDITGTKVATLVNNTKQSGSQSVVFYSNNLPRGLYFYKIQTEYFSGIKRMMLIN